MTESEGMRGVTKRDVCTTKAIRPTTLSRPLLILRAGLDPDRKALWPAASATVIRLALRTSMFTVIPPTMESLGVSSENPARFAPRRPDAGRAMLYGSVAFGLVSLLAYSIWAFRLVPGEAGLYSATAAV